MTKIKNFLTPQWLKEFEEMKRQASSSKPQAASGKRLQPKVASDKPQAPSDSKKDSKFSSDKQQAS